MKKRIKNLTAERFDALKKAVVVLRAGGMNYKRIGEALRVSEPTAYMVSRFDTIADYQKYNRSRLAKPEATVTPTAEPVTPSLTLSQDQHNSIITLLRAIEFNTRHD